MHRGVDRLISNGRPASIPQLRRDQRDHPDNLLAAARDSETCRTVRVQSGTPLQKLRGFIRISWKKRSVRPLNGRVEVADRDADLMLHSCRSGVGSAANQWPPREATCVSSWLCSGITTRNFLFAKSIDTFLNARMAFIPSNSAGRSRSPSCLKVCASVMTTERLLS